MNNQNCKCTWTENYNGPGVDGLLCKGKENTDYASNSVFLRAAGWCLNGRVGLQDCDGYYWSSTPSGNNDACYLRFNSNGQLVSNDFRTSGYSVRAVLKE